VHAAIVATNTASTQSRGLRPRPWSWRSRRRNQVSPRACAVTANPEPAMAPTPGGSTARAGELLDRDDRAPAAIRAPGPNARAAPACRCVWVRPAFSMSIPRSPGRSARGPANASAVSAGPARRRSQPEACHWSFQDGRVKPAGQRDDRLASRRSISDGSSSAAASAARGQRGLDLHQPGQHRLAVGGAGTPHRSSARTQGRFVARSSRHSAGPRAGCG